MVEQLWNEHPAHLVRELAQKAQVELYLVGGAVRDSIIGRERVDLDFVAGPGGEKIPHEFAGRTGGSFFWLDEELGQGRVVLAEGVTVDFAMLRAPDLDGDLRARDFTINAMAVDLSGGLLDPLGGRDDLAAGVIRACGPTSFTEDPLRLLRAFRFAAQLRFRLDPSTEKEIAVRGALLAGVAGERVRDELFTLLETPCWLDAVEMMRVLNVLPPLFGSALFRSRTAAAVADLAGLVAGGIEGDPALLEAYLGVETEDSVTRRGLLRLHALLSPAGPETPCLAVKRLRLGNRSRNLLVSLHRELPSAAAITRACRTGRSRHRFFADSEPAGVELLLLALAGSSPPLDNETRSLALDLLGWGLRCYRHSDDALLSGTEIMDLLGIGEGPEVGRMMELIRAGEREGVVTDQASARAHLVKNRVLATNRNVRFRST